MTVEPNVIYEDNHLLAVDKPAGMLSMGDDTGDDSLVDVCSQYLKDKYDKPGNVFLGVVHRLDRPVSGVILYARTSKAAARLSDQFRRNAVQKEYRAMVHGLPRLTTGTLSHFLKKNRETNHVSVVNRNADGGKSCELQYEVLSQRHDCSLLLIRPRTGRSHQIRVQLSTIGHPIVGDVKYGSSRPNGKSILLHATRLTFEHPTKKSPVVLESVAPFA